jgi:LAO/AO transport system kinase
MTDATKDLIEQIRGGTNRRVRAAARLMSLIENYPERIPEFLVGASDWPQPRMVLGLTGPPGCGKSLLADRLITALRRRHPDTCIGVIAVDPSSPFTGGAFLGDRLRMMRHAADPNVFIRSAATRGHIGGLLLGVKAFTRVLGLAGCRTVLIETVGVGQNETEIVDVADLVVVAIAPGHGDAVQLLKCGLMEVGDIFVVNKADCEGAAELYAQLLAVLRLNAKAQRKGTAEACLVSALHRRGVEELVDLCEKRAVDSEEVWMSRRRQRMVDEVKEAVLEEARQRLARTLQTGPLGPHDFSRILRGDMTVTGFVDELLKKSTGTEEAKDDHGRP